MFFYKKKRLRTLGVLASIVEIDYEFCNESKKYHNFESKSCTTYVSKIPKLLPEINKSWSKSPVKKPNRKYKWKDVYDDVFLFDNSWADSRQIPNVQTYCVSKVEAHKYFCVYNLIDFFC